MKNNQRLLSLKQVKELIPFSTMQIYRLEKKDAFPKRIKIGTNRVAWLEEDIQSWISSKIRKETNKCQKATP